MRPHRNAAAKSQETTSLLYGKIGPKGGPKKVKVTKTLKGRPLVSAGLDFDSSKKQSQQSTSQRKKRGVQRTKKKKGDTRLSELEDGYNSENSDDELLALAGYFEKSKMRKQRSLYSRVFDSSDDEEDGEDYWDSDTNTTSASK